MKDGVVRIELKGFSGERKIEIELGKSNRRQQIRDVLASNATFCEVVDVALAGDDDYPSELQYIVKNGRENPLEGSFKFDVDEAIVGRPSLDSSAIARDLAEYCADILMAKIINSKP